MSGGKGGKLKPFREDFIVLFTAVVIIVLVILVLDIPRGTPQWYTGYYGPHDESELPAGGLGDDPSSALVPIEEPLLDINGYTDEDGSTVEPFQIEDANTTEIHATLTWTDDIGDNDQFGLSLVYEGETVEAVSGTSGTLEISHNTVQPGGYEFVISAMDCPGEIGIMPIDRDNGNDWSLSSYVVRMTLAQQEGV